MSSAASCVQDLSSLLAQQKKAFASAGSVSADTRRQRLQQVIDLLVHNHEALTKAIDQDFGGRPAGFSLMNDVLGARRIPATIDDIPPQHLRQMAAYAEALRIIFPERRIEAKLLYTAGPVLHDLPSETLAAHLPSLAGA